MRPDLNKILKRFQPRSVLALTIESHRVAVTVVRRENGGFAAGVSVSIPVGADRLVADPAGTGAALVAELEKAGIRERRCAVCLPPAWALSASIDLPELDAADLRGYLELRAEREFSAPAAELRVAYAACVLPDGQRRATLAAVTAKRMDAVTAFLTAAGCRAVSISLALGGRIESPEPELLFLANSDRTDVIVAAGGGIAAFRSLPGPGGDAPFDPVAFSREVRITLGRLPEAFRPLIRCATFSGVSEAAGRLASELAGPLRQMGIEPSLPDSNDPPEAAVASAQRSLREQPVPFEFVVTEQGKWPAAFDRVNTSLGRRVGAGAFVAFVIAVVFLGMRSRTESRLVDEWSGMQSRVAELDGLQQKIRQFRPWFEPMPQNLQALEAVVGAFPERGEVWARSIQINENAKVTCAGSARTQPAFMALLDRLRAAKGLTALQVQQLRGDNPIQFSISCKWEARHDK